MLISVHFWLQTILTVMIKYFIFILPWWVLKFKHMVYEKCIIWRKKDKIIKKTSIGENKMEIMQNALKMQ